MIEPYYYMTHILNIILNLLLSSKKDVVHILLHYTALKHHIIRILHYTALKHHLIHIYYTTQHSNTILFYLDVKKWTWTVVNMEHPFSNFKNNDLSNSICSFLSKRTWTFMASYHKEILHLIFNYWELKFEKKDNRLTKKQFP